MKINNYSAIATNLKNIKFRKKNFSSKEMAFMSSERFFSKVSMPSFVFLKISQQGKKLEAFLSKKGKVTTAEYDEISKKYPRVLVECKKICDSEFVSNNLKPFAKSAILLKEHYDKLYRDYTILSIGTSPAPITEVMKNIGCDVIFLPISKLHEFELNPMHPMRHKYKTITSKCKNIKILMDYCTKNKIHKKGDNILILLDYVSSGKTIFLMDRVLKERSDLNLDNIKMHSIIHDLYEASREVNEFDFTQADVDEIKYGMKYCSYEKLANVPHFPFDGDFSGLKSGFVELKDKNKFQIFKEFDEYSTSLGRAWSLCCLHEAMKLLKK